MPLGPPTAKSPTAGPFIRYGNCHPGTTTWKGSVLFLTKLPGGVTELTNAVQQGDKDTKVVRAPSSPTQQYAVHANAGSNHAADPTPPTLTMDLGSHQPQTMKKPKLLDRALGWCFWRFEVAIEMEDVQRPVKYALEHEGARFDAEFWVPALGQPMHWAYTSCNGMSSGKTLGNECTTLCCIYPIYNV